MLYAMSDPQDPNMLTAADNGLLLAVKVVPGASRGRIAGRLGDRLKVTVAAAPEGGAANKAVCELLAKAFGVPRRDVQVVAGKTQPHKTIKLTGLQLQQARTTLTRLIEP